MTNKQTIMNFLQAAGRGELNCLESLLAKGVTVDAKNEIGYTALMAAARSYRVEIVKRLLELGANPNLASDDGHTVLHCAVGESPSAPERQAECVRLLLEAGASSEVMTDSGLTPLMNAAWYGCTLSVKELLKSGANPNVKDIQGRTALNLAKDKGHTNIVEALKGT